jgi:hypothetical protein
MHPRPLNSVQDVYIWTHLISIICQGMNCIYEPSCEHSWQGRICNEYSPKRVSRVSWYSSRKLLETIMLTLNSGHLLNPLFGRVINPYFSIWNLHNWLSVNWCITPNATLNWEIGVNHPSEQGVEQMARIQCEHDCFKQLSARVSTDPTHAFWAVLVTNTSLPRVFTWWLINTIHALANNWDEMCSNVNILDWIKRSWVHVLYLILG